MAHRETPMRGRNTLRRRLLSLAVASALASWGGSALANPTGASVAVGGATISANGKTLTVVNTPGAVINWQQFSIQKDEITRFLQQNASSAVLNRVRGGDPSVILGQLLSNGRVFLINPSGIAIGRGAVIDVAGFAASTLNISDADWVSGKLRFEGTGLEGKLENAGTIKTPRAAMSTSSRRRSRTSPTASSRARRARSSSPRARPSSWSTPAPRISVSNTPRPTTPR